MDEGRQITEKCVTLITKMGVGSGTRRRESSRERRIRGTGRGRIGRKGRKKRKKKNK
jgi:hypothetical protein